MNLRILDDDIQTFINQSLSDDVNSLLFKKELFEGLKNADVVDQIIAKRKCKEKLTTWFTTKGIYYPNKLNIEQTSSEVTAAYKAKLVSGSTLIDLTGGFGIDSYFFSKEMEQVWHCELNNELSEIVQHNSKQLQINNIEFICKNSLDFLNETQLNFDWIYVDPSRRNDHKGKVFLLEDCLPNVPENLDLLLSKSSNILIKVSPILDITSATNELKHVKTVHVIAVKNEVKELLFHIEKGYSEAITIKAINLATIQKTFEFKLNNESHVNYEFVQKYLYEPNAAIMKTGGFNAIASAFNLNKLHQHSHLYSSDELIEFPGRRFKIEEELNYNKKTLKRSFSKANITTRNFPKTVAELRKELQIKDGGNTYLFFTTNYKEEKIVLVCSKI